MIAENQRKEKEIMRLHDLHDLPKLRDGLGYLYLEHGKIDQAAKAISFHDKEGRVMVPVSSLAALMLGPGTSITHEAIKTLSDNGCLVNWVGEKGVRFYAQGSGETRKGYQLIRQAELVSDTKKRLQVVRRMYQYRFDDDLSDDLTLEQIRGHEGARVRRAYAEASREYGVPWSGRFYVREQWSASDTINRALSAANACLNSLCHSAIVSAGYSPGLGFVHQGKQLSFVYDIADLYKSDLTVPLAFRLTAESKEKIETRIRRQCRDLFHQQKLLARVIDDIDGLLTLSRKAPQRAARPLSESAILSAENEPTDFDVDPAAPSALWSPDGTGIAGGVNYGEDIAFDDVAADETQNEA